MAFSINGFSQNSTGHSSVDQAVNEFFAPLKNKKANISQAMSGSAIDSDSKRYAETKFADNTPPNFANELNKVMKDQRQGHVVSYKLVDSREALNGGYVVRNYEVLFFGGQKKVMEFKFVQPTTDNTYQFVDARFNE